MIDNLKDAITHAKEKASEQRRRFEDIYGQEETTEAERKEAIACLDCSNEHGQLAAWLEELKERREADRWISVKDRLPEKLVSVLAYDNNDVFVAWYDEGWKSSDSQFDKNTPIVKWLPIPKESEADK